MYLHSGKTKTSLWICAVYLKSGFCGWRFSGSIFCVQTANALTTACMICRLFWALTLLHPVLSAKGLMLICMFRILLHVRAQFLKVRGSQHLSYHIYYKYFDNYPSQHRSDCYYVCYMELLCVCIMSSSTTLHYALRLLNMWVFSPGLLKCIDYNYKAYTCTCNINIFSSLTLLQRRHHNVILGVQLYLFLLQY